MENANAEKPKRKKRKQQIKISKREFERLTRLKRRINRTTASLIEDGLKYHDNPQYRKDSFKGYE